MGEGSSWWWWFLFSGGAHLNPRKQYSPSSFHSRKLSSLAVCLAFHGIRTSIPCVEMFLFPSFIFLFCCDLLSFYLFLIFKLNYTIMNRMLKNLGAMLRQLFLRNSLERLFSGANCRCPLPWSSTAWLPIENEKGALYPSFHLWARKTFLMELFVSQEQEHLFRLNKESIKIINTHMYENQ